MYSSHLQRIHPTTFEEGSFEAASHNSLAGQVEQIAQAREAWMQYGSEWAAAQSPIVSLDSDIEVFSHDLTHGSFASLAFQPSTWPIVWINDCSRTMLNYYHCSSISRVKIIYLTMIQTQLTFLFGGYNPTLGEFYFTMTGRVDIEGSKWNIAMNAWLPHANYSKW